MTITGDVARNANFSDFVNLLRDQQARKLDLVVPATQMRFRDGSLNLRGTEVVLSDDGVDQTDGTYLPTRVFDEGISAKLGIPLSYVRRMREDRPDLYDANMNGMLHGKMRRLADGSTQTIHEPDTRSFMVRLFRGGNGEGVARSLHSDRYSRIDNLDVITAVLSGIRASGTQVNIGRCDLTERRMYVAVTCPDVTVMAPALLANYRSPFSGQSGADNPTVWAGFVVSNSETGYGAASITPRITVQVCSNGLTVTKDALRAVHLGARMDDGEIAWSEDTQTKQLELITAKARDAVRTFLSEDYVQRLVSDLEVKAGTPIQSPEKDIKAIGKALTFDSATIDGVLDYFIKGGDITAGGVMQAVTAYAQTVGDADDAYDLENAGMRALELAFRQATR